MGNWRTVQIVGTCDAAEVEALRAALAPGADYDNWHCLSYSGGGCGLPNWPATTFNAVGNLSERDYDVDDVAESLALMAKAAPSLTCKVHCGGEWESKDCVATVTVTGGVVTIGDPGITTLDDANPNTAVQNFIYQMGKQGH